MTNGTYYLTPMLPSLLLLPYACLKETPKPHDRISTDAGGAASVTTSTLQQSEQNDGTSTDIDCAVMNVSHHLAETTLLIPSVMVGKKIPLTAAEKRAKKTEKQRMKRQAARPVGEVQMSKTEKQRMKRQAMTPAAKLAARKKDSVNESIRLKQKQGKMTAAGVTQEQAAAAEKERLRRQESLNEMCIVDQRCL